MKRHYLSFIDFKHEIALCAACGYTEIYIPKSRKQTNPRAICVNKVRDLWLKYKQKQKLLATGRQLRPGWHLRHTLSEVDTTTLTAICSICGPTDIRKNTAHGYTRYACATHIRNYIREYNRSHYKARSTNPHALSNIDEEKQTAICAKCGPVKIEIRIGKRKITRRCVNAKRALVKADC